MRSEILVFVCLTACACTEGNTPPDVAVGPGPSTVLDAATLARFDPTVRRQFDEAVARLAVRRNDSGASANDLAAAWGDVASLQHAYELVAAARASYQEAATLAPNDPRWPYLRGRLEWSYGNPADAVFWLERSLAAAPENLPAWVALGHVRLEQGADAAAEEAFRSALRISPACAPAAVGLGKLALARGRLEEARAHLEAALAAQPQADSVHHHLARVRRRRGEESQALQHLRLAGPRQPTVDDPWFDQIADRRRGTHNEMARAQQLFRASQWNEAVQIYRSVVAAEPGHARAWTNLGVALARQGDLEAARVALERAAALAPGDALVLFDLGTVRMRLGDPTAQVALQAALAIDPRHAAARFNLATLYRQAGRDADELRELEALLEAAPRNGAARRAWAEAQLRAGRHAVAREGLERGIKLVPAAAELKVLLARLLATAPDPELRDGRRALSLARELLAREPGWQHRRTLAMALAESDQAADALEQQQQVLREAHRAGAPAEVCAALEVEAGNYQAGRPHRLLRWRAVDTEVTVR